MLWEGLFFDIWHSDKPLYQKENAEKIAKLFTEIGHKHGVEKQKLWFEAFMHIANLHWDKIDNYRIDKYLMFLRFQLNEVLHFLVKHNYDQELALGWFKSQMKRLYSNDELVSRGIPLQICDVFLQELNKVDAENISYANLA